MTTATDMDSTTVSLITSALDCKRRLDEAIATYDGVAFELARLKSEVAERAELIARHKAQAVLHVNSQRGDDGKLLYANEACREAAAVETLELWTDDPEHPYGGLVVMQRAQEMAVGDLIAQLNTLEFSIRSEREWLRLIGNVAMRGAE